MQVNEVKDERFQFRLPRAEKVRLIRAARENGLDNASILIRIALRDLFVKLDNGEPILSSRQDPA